MTTTPAEQMSAAEYRAQIAKRPTPRNDREHQEQCALMEWAAVNTARHPELALLFAIPNGGARHPAVAAKLKKEGVKSGVPDLCLPIPRAPYHALFIELKVPGGTASAAQLEWLRALLAQGYQALVCIGWEAAAREICLYLGLHPMECGL